MNKLQPLSSQLQRLLGARASVRRGSAWAAVGTAVIAALLGLFALDWFFQREVGPLQRVGLIAIAAGALVWAFRKYAWPLLSVQEDAVDMALMVERRQSLDSDLVAALQFQKDSEGRWGSKSLQNAVVDYVARVTPELDVFQGFSRGTLPKRLTIVGVAAVIALAVVAVFPRHAWVFLQRLTLRNPHYPTTAAIDAVVVDRRTVLKDAASGAAPSPIVCVEAQPVRFLALCRGTTAAEAHVRFDAVGIRGGGEILLKRRDDEERKRELQTARDRLSLPGVDLRAVAAELSIETPEAAEALQGDAPDVPKATELIDRTLANWDQAKRPGELYAGELSRLTNDVTYHVAIADAWTEAGSIRMAPLPQVEPDLRVVPPTYARKESGAIESAGRQAAVLEGSAVKLALVSKNGKPLDRAWLTLTDGKAQQRVDLKAVDADRLKWEIPGDSPLANVQSDWRYEGHAVDADGLAPSNPIRGSIRLRSDMPASLTLATIQKLVLPGASPVLDYKATDDYGLKGLRLVVEVVPAESNETKPKPPPTGDETDPDAVKVPAPEETRPAALVVNLLDDADPVLAKRLPLNGKRPLTIGAVKIPGRSTGVVKGDRLQVVLEAEDWRGDSPGRIVRSEPVILDVSDEAGVLASISEADQRSEERLNDIIKRQLGIGENQ